MKKILITGATGFVGRHLLRQFADTLNGVEILTVNRSVEKAQTLFPYSQCRHVSIDDCQSIVDFNPDIVIHLATLSTSRNDAEIIKPMLEANLEFGLRLLSILSACRRMKLFVNVGSFAEYRHGDARQNAAYLYTATKSAFRHFVDYYSSLNNFKYITAVPYTIYGEGDTAKKIMDYIRESLDSPTPVRMTRGEQILDFIHVDDVARFFVKTVENFHTIEKTLASGSEFFLGTGTGVSIRNLAKMIEIAENKTCNIEWGGLPYRPLDVMYAVAPVEKNNKIIDWAAKILLAEGIGKY
jgi:CDP-paratose synthetase